MKSLTSTGALVAMLGLWPGIGWAIPLELDISIQTSTADTFVSIDDEFTTENPDVFEDGPLDTESAVGTGSTTGLSTASVTYSDSAPPQPRDGQVDVNSLALIVVRPDSITFRMRAHNSGSTENNRDSDDTSLTAHAEASAFGEATFTVLPGAGSPGGAPILLFLAQKPLLGPDGTPALVFIRIENITLGAVIFDSDVSGIPDTSILLPDGGVGDSLRLTFGVDLTSTFAGERLNGAIGFSEDQTWILTAEASAVPEPASLVLMGLALTGLVIIGRRRLVVGLASTSLLVLALSPLAAQAGDADYLLDLIPGSLLSEEELAQYYGKGVNVVTSAGSSGTFDFDFDEFAASINSGSSSETTFESDLFEIVSVSERLSSTAFAGFDVHFELVRQRIDEIHQRIDAIRSQFPSFR